jgi:Mn-containing catalase
MVEHPAANAFTGYLLVRRGVHQIAYARAIENLTSADLTKMFPTARIETAKIPECQPHIQRGDHKRAYRFSCDDYRELNAVFNGVHPETGDKLEVVDGAPEGAAPNDLPPQPKAFVPDPHPEEIAEIATSSAPPRAFRRSHPARSTCRERPGRGRQGQGRAHLTVRSAIISRRAVGAGRAGTRGQISTS